MSKDERHRLSRRRFLGAVGASAGAVALDPVGAVATAGPATAHAPCAHAGAAAAEHFGRMFRLPAFAQQTPKVEAALRELGRPGGLLDAADPLAAGPKALIVDLSLSANNPNNPTHTAGTTFFGQFLDHDMTFDAASRLGRRHRTRRCAQLPHAGARPRLGLRRRAGRPAGAVRPRDHIKLKVESGGVFEDLPRRADGAAIVGDPRNDEHLIISGLHCAFLLFHNRAVDHVRAQGQLDRHDRTSSPRRAGSRPGTTTG